jgi:hypothetical protein
MDEFFSIKIIHDTLYSSSEIDVVFILATTYYGNLG